MSDDWNRWPAQEPPSDFADRAVAAMLRAERPARRAGGRWLVPLAVAAILVGSASWAMIGVQRSAASRPVPSAKAMVSDLIPELPPPRPPHAAPAEDPPAEPAATPSAPASPAPLAQPAPPEPAREPDPPSTVGSAVVVPRCICEHGTLICSCVE